MWDYFNRTLKFVQNTELTHVIESKLNLSRQSKVLLSESYTFRYYSVVFLHQVKYNEIRSEIEVNYVH